MPPVTQRRPTDPNPLGGKVMLNPFQAEPPSDERMVQYLRESPVPQQPPQLPVHRQRHTVTINPRIGPCPAHSPRPRTPTFPHSHDPATARRHPVRSTRTPDLSTAAG
ncbi:hypothetical protein GCM10029964_096260 [Kibdelosporangium lantanae]